MPGKITKKQEQILEYIKDQILSKGYPPSVREICTAVDLRSTSSVHAHLEKLEKNGYIRRDPAKPRCIEIVVISSSVPIDVTVSGTVVIASGVVVVVTVVADVVEVTGFVSVTVVVT